MDLTNSRLKMDSYQLSKNPKLVRVGEELAAHEG